MYARVIAFLLALVVAAGVASPESAAAPSALAVVDVAAVVDDRPADAEPVVAEIPAVLEAPVRRELRLLTASADASDGRLYLTSVFRPPRSVAFR